MRRPVRNPAPVPEPEGPQRGLDEASLKNFLHYLAFSGSVTYASGRAGIERRTLYRRKADDEAFAAQWEEALQLGIDRLQDNAMQRALHGTERPRYRNGKQIGSTQQYDNKLLQFLLRAHRPEIYGDRKQSAPPPLPFDLAQRLAASAPRLEAHLAERDAEESTEQKEEKKPRRERKNAKG
ncbi:MAG: hypothetical protein WCK95_28360 [Alphaproteobacteria bacterium]|jgi:hypothetical protein